MLNKFICVICGQGKKSVEAKSVCFKCFKCLPIVQKKWGGDGVYLIVYTVYGVEKNYKSEISAENGVYLAMFSQTFLQRPRNSWERGGMV